jgi:prepilin-type processing-associated H-X9-DG protein
VKDPVSPSEVNRGKALYKNHGQRFNYLLHDGHAETLRIASTLDSGTTNSPRGMWTVRAGD